MKRAAFLLFVILSFYIAGLYRYPPLLVLSAAALLSLPLLFFLPRHLKRRLLVEPVRRSETARKEEELECELRVRNTGRLPVSRFGLRVSAWYGDGQAVRKVSGADGAMRPQKYRMVLYGGCDSGESVLRFSILAGHCGLMRISLDRMRVYDYFSLFSAGEKLQEEMTAAVFPAPAELRLVFSSAEAGREEPETVSACAVSGDSRDEVRQLREYRPGDLGRDIHWDQSARMDALWVREYERETEKTAEIYLFPGRPGQGKRRFRKKQREEVRLSRLDDFYLLLSALIHGLLKQEIRVRVYWQRKKNGQMYQNGREGGFLIRNPEDLRQLLLFLYKEGFPFVDETAGELPGKAMGEGFCLNPDLELYWNGRLIHQFSRQRLEREMEEMVFVL